MTFPPVGQPPSGGEPDRQRKVSLAKEATQPSSTVGQPTWPSPAPATAPPPIVPASPPAAAPPGPPSTSNGGARRRPVSRVALIAGGAIAVVAAVLLAVVLSGGHSSGGNAASNAGLDSLAPSSPGAAPSSSPLSPAPTQTVTQTQVAQATQTVVRTVTAAPPKPGGRFDTYRNNDYGFAVQLPSSYVRTDPSSGSVATYESADGRVQVTLYDRPRNSATPRQDEAVAQQRFEDAGGNPTYTFHSSDEYVVSGYTAGGDVYYEFRYYGGNGIGGFSFTYPKSDKPVSDAVIAHAYKTFQPGNL